MINDSDLRCRVNAKQLAKGEWRFDATIEYKSDKISRSTSETDAAEIVIEPLGLRLLSMIKETEKAFEVDGRTIVKKEEM